MYVDMYNYTADKSGEELVTGRMTIYVYPFVDDFLAYLCLGSICLCNTPFNMRYTDFVRKF